jgi:TRAP transporter TAXI family solute receptor
MRKFNNIRMIAVVLVLMLGLSVLAGCGSSEEPEDVGNGNEQASEGELTAPVDLAFASLQEGSSWYVYAAGMADLLRTKLPSGSRVDVLPYSGGVGNAQLLADNEAQIGLVFNTTGKWAYDGTVAYEKPMKNIKGLVGKLDQYYVGILVTQQFLDKHNVETIQEIVDQKLPLNVMTVSKGSLGEYATSQLFEAYGVTYDDIKSWGGNVTHTSFDVAAAALQDGKADFFAQVITIGHPSFTEIAVTTPVQFMSISDDAVSKLEVFGNQPAQIPAGSFNGQDEPVDTVGFHTAIAVNDEMSEDVAYTITKTIVENSEQLENIHKGLKSMDPETGSDPQILGLPLHPGAEKYYQEIGWR